MSFDELINLSQAAELLEIDTTSIMLLTRRKEFAVIERSPTKNSFFNKAELTVWKKEKGHKYAGA